MPIAGTLDDASRPAADTPNLATEPVIIEGLEILQVMYEIEAAGMEDLVPPALHPTIPPTVTWLFWRASGGPLGPFSMAQTRVGCRAGVRPRGYLTGAVIDSEDAASTLESQWGYHCTIGDVALRRFHDRVVGRAPGLEVALVDQEAISGADVFFIATMNLAETPKGRRLVQVDPEYAFHRAERGLPQVIAFDASLWGEPRIQAVWPVSAIYSVADITLPVVRYICLTDAPALQGTEKVV